ncbi:hypothetical protein [Dulcicalothrix desertica]|uniref:hypothetical protein n=1 Tax=Dulcicalothrix desertica TaxID=32056 RepID=UPI000F8E95DD|nr:hypothetical protein [Dulcicalothrix desertica]
MLAVSTPVVARRNAVSVRVWATSLFSQGVVSMNQPTPLASLSMRRVPPPLAPVLVEFGFRLVVLWEGQRFGGLGQRGW